MGTPLTFLSDRVSASITENIRALRHNCAKIITALMRIQKPKSRGILRHVLAYFQELEYVQRRVPRLGRFFIYRNDIS